MDLGFYVFSLPFPSFLYGWLMSALVITALFSVLFHVVNGGILIKNSKLEFSLFARAHISTLLAMIVFLYGLGYRLDAYELLFSKIGKFYGAGYTAVNANLLAYNAAMIISFIAAGLFLFNIFKRSFKLPLILLAAIIPVYFILGTVFPGDPAAVHRGPERAGEGKAIHRTQYQVHAHRLRHRAGEGDALREQAEPHLPGHRQKPGTPSRT